MQISGVGSGAGPQEYQRQNAERPGGPRERQTQDSLQISEEAKRLLKEKGTETVGAQSDAEKRVESLQALIADKLVRNGSLKNADEANALAARVARSVVESEGSANGKLDTIRQRIESGLYDRPEVMGKIADRLMEDMGL